MRMLPWTFMTRAGALRLAIFPSLPPAVSNVPVYTLSLSETRASEMDPASLAALCSAQNVLFAVRKFSWLVPRRRPALIKQLKGDAATWVSKYAPGGSARKLSARRMYVAVDAVMGHIANAGLAPLPGGKFKVVEASMKDAVAFLADGR